MHVLYFYNNARVRTSAHAGTHVRTRLYHAHMYNARMYMHTHVRTYAHMNTHIRSYVRTFASRYDGVPTS